jgi:hypothetical protein
MFTRGRMHARQAKTIAIPSAEKVALALSL